MIDLAARSLRRSAKARRVGRGMTEAHRLGFLTPVGFRHRWRAPEVYREPSDRSAQKGRSPRGRLCALGSQSIAFDFNVDESKSDLAATSVRRDRAKEQDAGLAPWGVGRAGAIWHRCRSRITPLSELGLALVTAIGLARIARPGEVLIDPETPDLGG